MYGTIEAEGIIKKIAAASDYELCRVITENSNWVFHLYQDKEEFEIRHDSPVLSKGIAGFVEKLEYHMGMCYPCKEIGEDYHKIFVTMIQESKKKAEESMPSFESIGERIIKNLRNKENLS